MKPKTKRLLARLSITIVLYLSVCTNWLLFYRFTQEQTRADNEAAEASHWFRSLAATRRDVATLWKLVPEDIPRGPYVVGELEKQFSDSLRGEDE